MSLDSAASHYSPRIAIYARFSSDLQRDASIEDQVRVCRAAADRLDGTVVEVFSDFAISGSTNKRPGYQELLAAIHDRRVDIVIAEALDRFSRDQEHIAGFYKQTVFSGVNLITVADGEISELHVGLKGTMNALHLKDLGQKTHRGMEGRVREGKAASGKSYGYDVVRELDPRGEPIRGGRAINPAEAAVVQRIFTDFAAGHSPRAIAKALNAEGILSPEGKDWQDSSIRGDHGRGTGILRNQLYIGRNIWNRSHYVKNPITSRRVARPNHESKWTIKDTPELRIIEQELWDRVHNKLNDIRESGKSQKLRESEFWKHRRPKHLITNKAFCGCCGSPLATVGSNYVACAAARNKGTCTNSKGVRRDKIEATIIDALKNQLMQPDLVKEFADAFIAETNRLRSKTESNRAAEESELKKLNRKLEGLIDAIADGFRSPGLQNQLGDLEHRKAELEQRLKEPHSPQPFLHPNLAELYRAKVADLQKALNDPATQTESVDIIRSLIDKVVIHPNAENGVEIELVGDIVKMVELGTNSNKPAVLGAGLVAIRNSSVKVDAGARFELTTFRL